MSLNEQEPMDIKTIVHDGLNKARKNLLDLSGRNRLLNFKQSGAKILRFVDEIPNQIYTHLIEEEKKGFLVSPVPLPKKSDYPEIEDKEQLKKIDARLHAKNIGINTDWNLGSSNSSQQDRHKDDRLQTLHYPEDLDRVVRRIHSEAKTVIEESGVNMLFLCLGFLKWSDHEPTENYSHAPLILVPVEIQRHSVDAKTGFAKFRLIHTGEDILDNICLREKLAQMAIALPAFEDYDSPEQYFKEISEILADIKPEWAVERFATIGFLSFGKMLMYLDLDPAKWPDEEGITHIQDIFTGNHSSGDLIAKEFDLDGDTSLPHFSHVMDADSSQHSAIIDVMNGRNLVIEGPPGTGKSQTITNLIAACLEQGKTVLFVAEKSAALQVVQKRLDSLGLGHFCLSLHSHKMQKKALMSDLKARLELNNTSFRTAAKTAELHAYELRTKKTKLIEYSAAMNAPFGALEETPHNIFWKTDVLKSQLGKNYLPDDFVPPSEAEEITASNLRLYADLLNDLADTLRDYFQADHLNESHYWHGLNLTNRTDYAARQDILKHFKTLFAASTFAEDAVKQLEKLGLQNVPFKDLKNELSRLQELSAKNFEYADHLENIESDEVLFSLKVADELLVKEKKFAMALELLLHETGISSNAAKDLEEQKIKNSSLPQDIPLSVLYDRFNQLGHDSQNGFLFENTLNEAANRLRIAPACTTVSQLSAILSAANFLAETPYLPWSAESAEIEKCADMDLSARIKEKTAQLRLQKEELSKKFKFDVLPAREAIGEILEAFKRKTFLSPISSKWRAQLAIFKVFSNCDPKDAKSCVTSLQYLVDFIDNCEEFKRDPIANEKLPTVFRGLLTDTESLSTAAAYYLNMRSSVSGFYGIAIYDTLKQIDPVSAEWLKVKRGDFLKVSQTLARIKASFNAETSGYFSRRKTGR